MSRNKLTIILSVYGYKKINNLYAVLKSIKMQSEKADIIISEQGKEKKSIFSQIALEFGTKYVLSYPDGNSDNYQYNIGKVRNIGAKASETDYIYFSDADIVFMDENYLKNIMKIMKHDIPLYRPQMHRLSEQYVESFIERYKINTNIGLPDNDICLVDFDKKENCLKPLMNGEISEIINGQLHVCSNDDYNKVILNNDFDYTKIEEFIWKPSFHYGGTILSRDNFEKVGGYCENYYQWGMEDEDLHTKLKYFYTVYRIEKYVKGKPLLHLEHSRNYNNDIYAKNRDCFNARVNDGIDSMVRKDIINYKKVGICE